MSIEYYTRLERGNLADASEPVLDSLARALTPEHPSCRSQRVVRNRQGGASNVFEFRFSV